MISASDMDPGISLLNTPSTINPTQQPSPPHVFQGRPQRIALHGLFTLLVIAILANGMYFWLQKSQLIESGAYQEFLAAARNFEASGGQADFTALKQELRKGLLFIPGAWLPTKLAKDVLFLVFIIVSIIFLRRSLPAISGARWLPALLGLLVSAAFAHSLFLYGPLPATLGLRQFFFLSLVFLATWSVGRPSLALLSRYLVIALVLELVLAIYENYYGLPVYFSTRPGSRVTGTFSLPASLGIFAAVVFIFAAQFSRMSVWVLAALSGSLVYLSGSATAVILLGVSFALYLLNLVPAAWRTAVVIVLTCTLSLLVLLLPKLTSRPDVYDSLFGRMVTVENFARQTQSPGTLLVGRGLGVGSNVVNSAAEQFSDPKIRSALAFPNVSADSTPMALMHQMGLAGVLMFYLMIGLAAWRDPRARPIYLVLFLASLTVNITELFPVNFLLGLLLCHSYRYDPDKSHSTHGNSR